MSEPSVIEPPIAPAPQVEVLYFKKILSNMPFYINRVPVGFEQLDRNIGVLKIDASNPTAAILTATAKANRGGIVIIDADMYESLKKKLPFNPLAQRSSQPKLQIIQTELPRKPKVVADGSVVGGNQVFGRANGVGAVDGRGTGVRAGTQTPAPVSVTTSAPPGEFKPATGEKIYKTPVVKKTTSRSFEGGIPEPEPTG